VDFELDSLRRCIPSSIRQTLDELPTSLDETYERALQRIPREKQQHAHRLFQCLVAAIRPLHVEELAEILSIDFDPGATSGLVEGWRPENPEAAVLSTCSTLITIIDNGGWKIVKFSHSSVKDFLVSDRLRISRIENIRAYHISMDAAHAVLARACLTVLLQFDKRTDKTFLAGFPLAFYAARHWVYHARYEGVTPRVQDVMERLFNPNWPYLASWVWIHDADQDGVLRTIDDLTKYPHKPRATALYYAALCGFSELVNYLVVTHAEDANAKCGNRKSPLRAAVHMGHHEVVRVLLDNGADVGPTGDEMLMRAYNHGHLEVMRLLLEHGTRTKMLDSQLLHDASRHGRADVIQLLFQHKANVDAKDRELRTPLHCASIVGDAKVAQLLLEHGADVNAQSNIHETPLYLASQNGCPEVVRLLLYHGANVHIQGSNGLAPFQTARLRGYTTVGRLLLEHGAEKK